MSDSLKYIPARPEQAGDLPRIGTRSLKGKGTPLIYFPGFGATMAGNKAEALAGFAAREGIPLVRFDYQGIGASGGDGAPGTITLWRDDAISVIDQLIENEVIIVGSSMGAWIALLAALARPANVRSLVLIACAADFTEPMRQKPDADPGIGSGFPKGFMEDGANHLLLDAMIEISCPVTLIHGQNDATIPWQNSLKTATKLQSTDVIVHVRSKADHRLSTEPDLEFMFSNIRKHLG